MQLRGAVINNRNINSVVVSGWPVDQMSADSFIKGVFRREAVTILLLYLFR